MEKVRGKIEKLDRGGGPDTRSTRDTAGLPDAGNEPLSTTATVADAWTGWFRQTKRQPWRKVVGGETEADAWQRLLAALPQLGDGLSAVTQGDRPPTTEKAR